MSTQQRPLPQTTVITQPFWDACAEKKLVIQQCNECGNKQFYPRILCLQCASDDLQWLQCSGKGLIYSYTVNHRAPHAYFKEKLPYVVAVVTLDEGVRMLANIFNFDREKLAINAAVKVVFENTEQGFTLPEFELL